MRPHLGIARGPGQGSVRQTHVNGGSQVRTGVPYLFRAGTLFSCLLPFRQWPFCAFEINRIYREAAILEIPH